MGAIGFLVLWTGYAVFYYGFDQIRGGNNGFLDLALPGRYKALPTDQQIAGGNQASGGGNANAGSTGTYTAQGGKVSNSSPSSSVPGSAKQPTPIK